MVENNVSGWEQRLAQRQKETAKEINAAPINPIPSGWKMVTVFAVGGLHAVGFAENSEELLVASSNGQSVTDGLTGVQLYRNRESDGYDSRKLTARRLDQPDGPVFRMSGLEGGGLRTCTDDGWRLSLTYSNWPKGRLLLHEPKESPFPSKNIMFGKTVLAERYEFRAWGFSWSGKVMVWSDEVDVRVYRRETGE